MSETSKEDKKITEDEEEEEEAVEKTVTTTKTKGILGFNFNDPVVLIVTVLGVGIFGALAWNVLNRFIFNKPAPVAEQPKPKEANITITPEQLRRAQYNRDLEIAASNMLAKEFNNIEQTNKEIRTYGNVPPHYYDQYYNSYARGPKQVFEDEIEVFDDNSEIVETVKANRDSYFRAAPTVIETSQPVAVKVKKPQEAAPPLMPVESVEVLDDDQIDMVTNNEPDLNNIPPEFVNVGNSETAFDKIEPKKGKQQEDVNFENLEMDEKTLNEMVASANVSPSGNYY